MKKYFLFIIILTTLVISGCFRGTIKGVVVNEINEPVVGAVVTTDPPTQAVLTTQSGFVIRNIPKGIYSVKATKAGYMPSEVNVFVKPNESVYADIQIKRENLTP